MTHARPLSVTEAARLYGYCPQCGTRLCHLIDAPVVKPSRNFRKAFPLGGLWQVLAGVALVCCVYAFAVLVL